MRILGAILIIIACVGIGVCRAMKYHNRVTQLEKLTGLLSSLQTEMRFSGDSVPELIRRYEDKALWLRDCRCLMEQGEEYPIAWKKAVERSSFWKQEREILLALGEELGQSDLEGQQSLLMLSQSRLKEIMQKAKEEQRQQMRLSPMLGGAAGVVILLFLL